MIRSRRLALVAVAVALGLTACGDPNVTQPLADGPPVIQLASGQTVSAGGAAPAATTRDAADESKIAFMGSTEFVYDGELPALGDAAGSWFFAPGQTPDVDRIAKLAASLGVVGDVRVLPDEQGGGWAVGPEDYSGAVLTVGSDGMLSWWLSAAPSATPALGCGMSGVEVDPAADSSSGSGSSTDAVAPNVVAPDTVVPDCPIPPPPVGVPTADQALAKAKELFADWGSDVDSYQFDAPYADEWGASVNASLLLDGMKAPIMVSVGFGENGAVTWASGYLAVPERGADYPTIGAAAGLERLKTQQNQYIGFDETPVMASSDDRASQGYGDAGAIAPDYPVCEPESASATCAPGKSEPVTVTLNSVKTDLTMVWATDNTIWLLPAYSFGSTDGGIYTVLAVDDAFIQQVEPAIATSEPAVDPGIPPVAETVPAGGGGDVPACTKFQTPTDVTTPGLDIAWAQRWVGLCVSYAESEASVLGWSVRVVRQDGVDLAVTADYSDTRFNLAVKGEIITEIISIG